jgi:tetratricopeptide (TPR) repeat protein
MAIHRMQQENAVAAFSPSEEEDFGAFIERIRRRSRIQIQEVVAQFPEYLNAWDRFTYSHLVGERKRTPLFEELLPLYKALVVSGVHFSAAERNHFLALARLKIESKTQRRGVPYPTEQQWRSLQADFAAFDRLPLHPASDQNIARSRAPHPIAPLEEDRRHLVGRDGWIEEMHSYLDAPLAKKLVVVQAAMGAGKSSGLHLIRRSLEEGGAYQIIFSVCASPSNMTHEEHLDQLLAAILVHLGIQAPEADMPPPSLPQRINHCLYQLSQTSRRAVIFIDNGEVILSDNGQLSPCWQQFLADFLRYQHEASLVLATRAWPLWKGRDRIYLAETNLPPLTPEAGAAIWKHLGFDGVPEALLQQASIRCGGNPWFIELRASTLQRASQPPIEQEHVQRGASSSSSWDEHNAVRTRLLERLLEEPHLFSSEADFEAQGMLQEVLNTHLSPQAYALLAVLALSPVPLAFSPLKEFYPQVEESFAEIQRASLVDLDAKLYAGRAQLLPLVTEAMLHRLQAEGRIEAIEEHVIDAYKRWLKLGIQNDQEKSAVVAELIAFSLKQRQLLGAAERLRRYHWLLVRFGYAPRLARLAQAVMGTGPWRSTCEQECGGLLLHYHLAPFLGQKISLQERARAYQRIYTALLDQQVHLQVPTELHLVHYLMLAHMSELRFEEAERLLNQTFGRLQDLERAHPTQFASLLGRKALLLGTWSEYAQEQRQQEQACALREQAIAVFRQCVALCCQSEEQASPAKRSTLKYRRARHLNDLGYYVRKHGRFQEALEVIEESLALKMGGYVEPGSLATSYSEKAQCLAALGRFQEAFHFDQLAVDDIRQAAEGNSALADDMWIYLVERGSLYLRVGRIDEAGTLFGQASSHIGDDRRSHRAQAQEGLAEIERWREISPGGQLDWRWAARYREAVRYDPFQWLSHAGPFTGKEQEEWTRLQGGQETEEQRTRLETILTQSRNREVQAALEQGREPRFQYPCIPSPNVKRRIGELRHLAADIAQHEPNALVRRLYLEVIDEHVAYLQMIQATHDGDVQAFWQQNRSIHAEPSPEEMQRALSEVGRLMAEGMHHPETAEVSERLSQFLRGIGAPLDVPPTPHGPHSSTGNKTLPSSRPRMLAPHTVRRFFDAVMCQYGFDGWQTVIDVTANDPRIEQLTQCLILPDKQLSVERVRTLLSHEIESHVFRAAAGEKSRLNLLATGTRGFMATEEGLALYNDRETARLQGKASDEISTASLFGTLATGLASGVASSPLTFSRLCAFLELFLYLYRRLNHLDKDEQRTRVKARDLARIRCLRTFRGVPDLTVAGVAYVKDALYMRGERMVSQQIQEDNTVLERLMVGVVGVEQLPDMEELGIVKPPYPPKWLAHDPDLGSYILSFEAASDGVRE